MSAELTYFANFIGLEAIAPGRYSMLLLLGLFGGFKSGALNPAKVIHEIQALEGIGTPSQLKPPSQFNRPKSPLKGLWHKHYLEDGLRALALNVKKGLDLYGIPLFQQCMREAQEAGEERYVTIEDIKPLANDVVSGNWKRLANAEALSGEWIIYAQHEGKNHYLCLARHDSGDDYIRQQIDAICCHEFPFLTTLLNGT
ncbi:hypothetical protein F6R98_02935 [Candidatus Methylospira mobilis]|uniref:Uncharacterized protein n=2 Tax=Candidatus Methylospira mobilis TaxID=1808979 RepID=A0A5Q0BLW7_9GAMM|nr:hypothetical protein F6R98_02935 [Candidatus Methylospira mobilis]